MLVFKLLLVCWFACLTFYVGVSYSCMRLCTFTRSLWARAFFFPAYGLHRNAVCFCFFFYIVLIVPCFSLFLILSNSFRNSRFKCITQTQKMIYIESGLQDLQQTCIGRPCDHILLGCRTGLSATGKHYAICRSLILIFGCG